MSDLEDKNFLCGLISKLNAELSRYRNKTEPQPIGPLQELLASGEAHWLWDKNTLSPLLGSMEETISEQRKIIDEQASKLSLIARNELNEPKSDLSHKLLSQQNHQLRQALNETRAQLNKMEQTADGLKTETPRLVRQLEQANRNISDLEKQTLDAKLEATSAQNEKKEMEKRLICAEQNTKKHLTRANELESNLSELTQRFGSAVVEMNGAVNRHRDLARVLHEREELILAVNELVRHHKLLVDTVSRMEKHEKERTDCLLQLDSTTHELIEAKQNYKDAEFELLNLKETLNQVLSQSVCYRDVERMKNELILSNKSLKNELQELSKTHAMVIHKMEQTKRETKALEEEISKCNLNAQCDFQRGISSLEFIQQKCRMEEKKRAELSMQFQMLKANNESKMLILTQEKEILQQESTKIKRINAKLLDNLENLKQEQQNLITKLDEATKTIEDLKNLQNGLKKLLKNKV